MRHSVPLNVSHKGYILPMDIARQPDISLVCPAL